MLVTLFEKDSWSYLKLFGNFLELFGVFLIELELEFRNVLEILAFFL